MAHPMTSSRMMRTYQRHALLWALAWIAIQATGALAADACHPLQLDICAFAEKDAKQMQRFIDSRQDHGMFRNARADGGIVRRELVVPETEAQLKADAPEAYLGMTYSIMHMHDTSRHAICRSPLPGEPEFMANGGSFDDTYFSSDGKRITEVRVANCDDSATTWAGTDADPCKPMGQDVCAFATRFAAGIKPATTQGEPVKRASANGATIHFEVQFEFTRAQFAQSLRQTTTSVDAENGAMREKVIKTSCAEPLDTFIAFGGSVRHTFRYKDGEIIFDRTVSQCDRADAPPATPTPGTH